MLLMRTPTWASAPAVTIASTTAPTPIPRRSAARTVGMAADAEIGFDEIGATRGEG